MKFSRGFVSQISPLDGLSYVSWSVTLSIDIQVSSEYTSYISFAGAFTKRVENATAHFILGENLYFLRFRCFSLQLIEILKLGGAF